MADTGEQKQVTVRLTTRLPAPFRVPPHPLAVPAQLTRYGLSEVVNSLLKLGARHVADSGLCATPDARGRPRLGAPVCRVRPSDKPVPFDFLINDQLLQVSLEAFLLERSISAVRANVEGARTVVVGYARDADAKSRRRRVSKAGRV